MLRVQVPEAVTDAGSRAFLAEHGLPEAAAYLDFGVLAQGRLAELTAWPGGPVVGDGRLFVLGEPEYGRGLVVLDAVSGDVWLAEWTDGELRRDLLASDLPAFFGLLREAESVARAAEDREAGNGHRGAGITQAVVQVAEERMREVDPRLFEAVARPAHWGTAARVAALAWGAWPGTAGPDGLAYEFDADLVEELAVLSGERGVRRYRPEELPPALTHEPTRRLLTETGLALDGQLFVVPPEGPLRGMAQAHAESGPLRDHLAVGWWLEGLPVALDGATGRVEVPPGFGDGRPDRYLNRDLSALLYALWTYEKLRDDWWRWEDTPQDWEVHDPQALLLVVVDGLVEAVDPEAFATPAHTWRMLAEDPYTGGLLA